MPRKGILLIGNYPPPYGGVPRHIEDLAPYLVEKGWNVHILSGGKSGPEKNGQITVYRGQGSYRHRLASALAFLTKIPFRNRMVYLRTARLVPFSTWLKYMLHAQHGTEIIKRTQIDLISGYNLSRGGAVGAILSQLHGLPLVVTNFGEIYSQPEFFRKHSELVGYITETADRLVAMTHHCANSYSRLDYRPNVQVIPIGVDAERFSPTNDGATTRKKLGIAESDQVVLFVGRMIEDLGLHTLLSAIPTMLTNSSCKIIIAGGSGTLLPIARQVASQYNKRIIISPDVPLAELPLYYAASDLLVAPTISDRACGSLASAEAMATSKPVVAARIGGVPEFVIDGITGLLIPPQEPETLASTVLTMLRDPDRMLKLGQNGRQHVIELLNKVNTNRQYERLFTETVNL